MVVASVVSDVRGIPKFVCLLCNIDTMYYNLTHFYALFYVCDTLFAACACPDNVNKRSKGLDKLTDVGVKQLTCVTEAIATK